MTDLFKAGASEGDNSESAEILETNPEEASQGLPEKKIEGTDKNFQSRYDKAMKELAAKQESWEQERLQSRTQFEQLQRQIEELKRPPEKVLSEPVKPSNFNYADAMTEPESESARYMQAMENFNASKYQKLDKTVADLRNQLEEEKRIKMAQAQNEMIKAQTLGAFSKEGLTPEEANDLYLKLQKALTTPNLEEGAKQFAQWFKLEKSQPTNKAQEFEDRNNKRQGALPPGLSASGSLNDGETDSFVKGVGGNKKTGIYATTKKG